MLLFEFLIILVVLEPHYWLNPYRLRRINEIFAEYKNITSGSASNTLITHIDYAKCLFDRRAADRYNFITHDLNQGGGIDRKIENRIIRPDHLLNRFRRTPWPWVKCKSAETIRPQQTVRTHLPEQGRFLLPNPWFSSNIHRVDDKCFRSRKHDNCLLCLYRTSSCRNI